MSDSRSCTSSGCGHGSQPKGSKRPFIEIADMTTKQKDTKAPTGAVGVSGGRKKPAALDLDAVIARLESGETLTTIAESMGLARSSLCYKIDAAGGSARVVAARSVAAAAYAEQAETVLKKAGDPFELAKAKELAHHYRWQASKANPGQYGDKIQADVDMSLTVVLGEF